MKKTIDSELRQKWGFKEPWIGVDLDFTLAKCGPDWQGYHDIGEPIPNMILRVKLWIAQGKRVKIFTSRVEGGKPAIRAIHTWLKAQGLPELEVTNIKDSGMVELWDDLAVKVIKNTGRVCCKYKKNWKVRQIDS